MELMGDAREEQLDDFFPIELVSSTHSESSDDLMVWCTGDDFESDTSLTSHKTTESSVHATLISNTDPFPNHRCGSSSFISPFTLSMPLQRSLSLWERPWILTTHHHRHHSDSPVILSHECPSNHPQPPSVDHNTRMVDYIEPDISHGSSLLLNIAVTNDRSTLECGTSVVLPSEQTDSNCEIEPTTAAYFTDSELLPISLSDFGTGCAVLDRAGISSNDIGNDFVLETNEISKCSFNGLLVCTNGSSARDLVASPSDVTQPEASLGSNGLRDCDYSGSDLTATKLVDLYHSVPKQQSLANSSEWVMLCQKNELLSGNTLTCILVNVLRGLRLLDRCGLDDLCATLCDLHSMDQSMLDSKQYEYCFSSATRIPGYGSHSVNEVAVTRSSSFTSSCLVSPRHSRVHEHRRLLNATFHDTPGPHADDNRGYCCVVDFILKCSARGTSVPQSPDRHSMNSVDWRHGRSNKVVTLFTSNPFQTPLSHSRTTVHKLLTGRFLSGPIAWRCVWPWANNHLPLTVNQTFETATVEELAHWLRVWISRGAAILLAELACPERINDANAREKPRVGDDATTATELFWRHRLIYGVTDHNEACLLNPEQLVPLSDILRELSRQTSLGLAKTELVRLWFDHQRSHKNSELGHHSSLGFPDSHCTGDFSSLVCQEDPRWCKLNVLGQVLQTLRISENSTPIHSASTITTQLDQTCLSPLIYIPCSQSPGFSVFVARSDWELCHALHGSRRLFQQNSSLTYS